MDLSDIVVTNKNGKVQVSVKDPTFDNTTGVLPEYTPLQHTLDIQYPTQQEKERMTEIWNALEGSPTERLVQIRKIENRIGRAHPFQSRLSRVHEFVKVTTQINGLKKLKREIVKPPL